MQQFSLKFFSKLLCLALRLPHEVQMIMYFLMNLEIIHSVFKQIFSQHQYFIDHLVKIYKATLNLVELGSKI